MKGSAVFITIGKGSRTVIAVLLFCALTLLPLTSGIFAQETRPEHNRQAQCNALFAQGADLEKQEDYAGAGFNYAECRELAKIHQLPQMEAAALHRLAVIEARSKKFTKSAEMFRTAAALDKKNVLILCDFAQLYADRRMYDDAETILKNALMMEPNNRKVLYGLGFTIAQQRDREAEGCRYLKLALGEAQGYRELAKIYRTKGNLNQAEYAEQKAALAAANPAPVNLPQETAQSPTVQPQQLKPSLPLPHIAANSNTAASNNTAVKPPMPVLTVTPPAVVQRNKEELLRLETKELSEKRDKLQMAVSEPLVRDPFLDAMYIPAPAAPAAVFPAVQAAVPQPVLVAGLPDTEKMYFKNPAKPAAKTDAPSANFTAPRIIPSTMPPFAAASLAASAVQPPAEFPPAKSPQTHPTDLVQEETKKSESVTFIRPESGNTPKTDVKLVKIPSMGKNAFPKNGIAKSAGKPDNPPPKKLDKAAGTKMLRIISNPEGSPSIIVEQTPAVGTGVSGDVSQSDVPKSGLRRTPLVGPGLVDSESQAALIAPLPKFTSLGGVRKIPEPPLPQTAAVKVVPANSPSGQKRYTNPYATDPHYTAKADFVLKKPVREENVPMPQPVHLIAKNPVPAQHPVPSQPENIHRMPPPHTEIADLEARELLERTLDKAVMESVKVADNSRHSYQGNLYSQNNLPRYTLPESIPVRNQPATEHQFVPNTAPNVLAFGIAEKTPQVQPQPKNVQAEQAAAAPMFPPQVLDFAVKEAPESQKALAVSAKPVPPQPEVPLHKTIEKTPHETLRDPFLAAFKEPAVKTLPPEPANFAVNEMPESQKTLAAVVIPPVSAVTPAPQPEMPLHKTADETPRETLRNPFFASFKEPAARTLPQQETLPRAASLPQPAERVVAAVPAAAIPDFMMSPTVPPLTPKTVHTKKPLPLINPQPEDPLPPAAMIVRDVPSQPQEESAPGFATSRSKKSAEPEEPAGFARTKR